MNQRKKLCLFKGRLNFKENCFILWGKWFIKGDCFKNWKLFLIGLKFRFRVWVMINMFWFGVWNGLIVWCMVWNNYWEKFGNGFGKNLVR